MKMLLAGLEDGQPMTKEDEDLIVPIVAGGFVEFDDALDMARQAAATRPQRERAYK